jgi:hypothetical protein
MPSIHRRRLRLAGAALVLALPLLATGPCLLTAEQALINGFFDAVTPMLVDRFASELGVTPSETPGTTTSTGTGVASGAGSASV